jgi:lysine-N-methylase
VDLLSTRYMTRFRCLGGECEDNCCREWEIYVDREHYEGLRARMKSPAEKRELAAGMRLNADPSDPNRHAFIVLAESGSCSFLGADRLCTLHGRYGEPQIPNACATYPRVVGRVGDRAELTGSPSCPEVARLLLLSDDSLDIVDATQDLFGRGMAHNAIDPDKGEDYQRTFPMVRELCLRLLDMTAYPISSRLYFLAFFADKMREGLRRGGKVEVAALMQTGRAMLSPQTLAPLHEQVGRIAADDPFAFLVVRELLRVPARKLGHALSDRLAKIEPLYGDRKDVDALARAFAATTPLTAAQAERLDLLLERYAKNHVLRDWYTARPSFVGYVHGLLARLALIRFLVRSLAHLEAPADEAAFDALVVRALYPVARFLDHNANLADELARELERNGMTQLAHAIHLVKI